jgi:hypothetical protein
MNNKIDSLVSIYFCITAKLIYEQRDIIISHFYKLLQQFHNKQLEFSFLNKDTILIKNYTKELAMIDTIGAIYDKKNEDQEIDIGEEPFIVGRPLIVVPPKNVTMYDFSPIRRRKFAEYFYYTDMLGNEFYQRLSKEDNAILAKG